jgi:hypothetical protein
METSEAARIIQALADGVDPDTGEVFPDDSPYQHPQVVRALFTALKVLDRQEQLEQREQRESRLPANAGKPWDQMEDKLLCQSFDAGLTTSQLASQHQRTEGSIRSRLEKLGKIQV